MANYHDILLEIRERHGLLTPETVVEEARPARSPLHAVIFDKAEPEAAEAYYRENARKLIQSVRVTVECTAAEPVSVRAFLAVPSEQPRYVFEPREVVLADAEKLAMVRLAALQRIREAERSLEELTVITEGSPAAQPARRAAKALGTARAELEHVA